MSSNSSGLGPVRLASPSSSALMVSTSCCEGSTSNSVTFSVMRAGVVDVGTMMPPRWMCRRRAGLVQHLEHLPGRYERAVVARGQRPVDQEQVDVPEVEVGQRGGEGSAGVVRAVETVVEPAGDEHLRAVQTRSAHALAGALLVAVHLRGVDVAVARVQRHSDGPGGLGRVDLEDAEAELGDRGAVVQGDRGNGARGPTVSPRGSACPLSRPTAARRASTAAARAAGARAARPAPATTSPGRARRRACGPPAAPGRRR